MQKRIRSYTVHIDEDRADEFARLVTEEFGDDIELDFLDIMDV